LRRTLSGAVLLVLVLAVAGCQPAKNDGDGIASVTGSSKPGTSSSNKPLTKEERAELARKYTACMKEHGVTVQVVTGDGDSGTTSDEGDSNEAMPDEATTRKAQEACRQYEPSGGDLPKLNPDQIDQLRKFTKCMRDNGVDMGDPDADGRIPVTSGTADPNSDVERKAMEKCRHLQQGPGSGG
jgi:hypothetical protein